MPSEFKSRGYRCWPRVVAAELEAQGYCLNVPDVASIDSWGRDRYKD
jgi:hypothetical protein